MSVSPKYAIAAIACCALLTSCGGNGSADGSAAPTSSPATVTSTLAPTTAPTTSADAGQPEPPALPALARERSTAGAKAFIRHYVDVLNYAWIDGHGSQIRELSSARCDVCDAIANFVDQVSRRGGSQDGGDWRIDDVFVIPGQPVATPIGNTTIEVAASSFKPRAGAPAQHTRPREVTYDFYLVRQDHRWQIVNLSS